MIRHTWEVCIVRKDQRKFISFS